MKRIILIITLVYFSQINAQFNDYKFGKVFFKDGTEKWGFIKFKDLDKIQFKKEMNNKAVIFGYEDIVKLNNDSDFEYLLIDNKPRLLKVVLKGKINLYSSEYMYEGLNGFSAEYTAYYIEKNEKITITDKNFKKKYDFIIKDCNDLYSKLQNKEMKRKELETIIDYYNINCN